MKIPSIRLAFGAIFWRIFLVSAILAEIFWWEFIRRQLPGLWKHRRLVALAYVTPSVLFRSFLLAAILTILLDQLVRLVSRPIASRWYFPQGAGSEETPLGFHLDVSEQLVAEVPARQRIAGGWRPGTLVLTTRTLWFFPVTWDLEPWSLPRGQLKTVRSVPYRPLFGSFVRGVPDRLVVRDQNGSESAFAVAEPRVVLAWFSQLILPDWPAGLTVELAESSPESRNG